jgi:NAD(P)-dependent dehydrogenase (short-subunit alcohol dehydrogenase family)
MNPWSNSDALATQPTQVAGRTYLITGANSGLGFESARALAKHGAKVILGCRNVSKGESARSKIREESPSAETVLCKLDLSSLASIRAAAAQLATEHASLDGLVNNAGIMAIPKAKTIDGMEMQIGTNHFGHFALTSLLLPMLEKAQQPRIVTVSSIIHKRGTIVLKDLFFEQRPYKTWEAYGQSKLANLMFALELSRRLRSNGSRVKSLAAHPGYAATELQSKGPQLSGSSFQETVMKFANNVFAQSQERGAMPQLRALCDPEATSGEYYGPSGFQELWGNAVVVLPSPRAHDEAIAKSLWGRSVELTGETFGGI